ncbi:ABC transporter ATP-binding protein [Paenibacillus koleovorans]|uniref:ABC transporter ATP-binding protein n=1 Tax=Paenibacillus koleovorans TaxID=121608 RepID=UPI000FDAD08C|nr:ABC transporter ATP-binding protein [Paenibacillus koleovorans]
MNTVALRVDRVAKHYGSKTAVNGVQFEVRPGEVYGLLGANGAGKTTTMRMVLGLILPDEGSISWKGQGYREELKSMMGYLPEERGLYPKVKVSEQIVYLAELRGMARKEADRTLKHWLEKFEVSDYYDRKVEELSKGNQQKIQFIAAVIHNPDILILDEAFSGLDPVNVELLKKNVKELRDAGTAILFSSHRMDHVEELCENITILHRSKTVLQGELKRIKRSFPRERILLETEEPVDGLENIPGVLAVNRHQSLTEILVKGPEAGRDILRQAMSQAEVTRFQIMEPTLNEIFIRTVGGERE